MTAVAAPPASAMSAGPAPLASGAPAVPGDGQGFTPLHLFECTITNASMLVDSMTTRDLVTALRVLSGLHSRIVDVMEPSVGAACQLAEQHKAHCQQLLPDTCGPAGLAASASAPVFEDVKRRRRKRSRQASPASDGAAQPPHAPPVKSEGGDASADDEDDCLVVMEEAAAAGLAAHCSSFDFSGIGGIGFGASVTGAATSAAACSTPELRAALKESYKELKSAGADLFDFARPFDDPVNAAAAHRVISCAQARGGPAFRGVPMEAWRGTISGMLAYFKCSEDKHEKQKANTRKHNRKYAKLTRRQKSFEALLPELSPDELDEYRLVLTRDFTTSDEESEDERGRERLRTRELPWESDRVRAIKRRLDDLFLKRFATQKQRDQLARCLRDGSARSNRPQPESAPAWALRPPPSNGGGF